MVFLKNGLPVLVPVIPTDRFIGFDGFQPLMADRFTGFRTDLSVILTGLLILGLLKFKI
jgi:hypothetical protein